MNELSRGRVSVIIPAYNVEQYIDECIRSIATQTYDDIEIIVVIDGATDATEERVRRLSMEYNNIIISHQINSGSGPARNRGLSLATGEFVMFVDSDDWIEREMIEQQIRTATQNTCDLVITGCKMDYYDDAGTYQKSETYPAADAYYADCITSRNNYLTLFSDGLVRAPWGKLYRTSIIRENGIIFPNLRRSQDIVFNYEYYRYVTSVRILNITGYHYRQLAGEQQKKIKPDYYQALARIYSDVTVMHETWDIQPDSDSWRNFCNYLFQALCAQLVYADCNHILPQIVNHDAIHSLCRDASPDRIPLKIMRILLLRKRVFMTSLYLRIIKAIKLK